MATLIIERGNYFVNPSLEGKTIKRERLLKEGIIKENTVNSKEKAEVAGYDGRL